MFLDRGGIEHGLGFFRDRVLERKERTICQTGHHGTLAWTDFDYGLVGVLLIDREWKRLNSSKQKVQNLIREIVFATAQLCCSYRSSVLRQFRHLANGLLLEKGLPAVKRWLCESDRPGWLLLRQKLELIINPTKESLEVRKSSCV